MPAKSRVTTHILPALWNWRVGGLLRPAPRLRQTHHSHYPIAIVYKPSRIKHLIAVVTVDGIEMASYQRQ
jgi:hypothetical protein